MEPIVNKVAESGLVTLDLADYYPTNERAVFDIKDYLFMGMILKEKDFRAALLNMDWQQYSNKDVAVSCSVDAIIPMWSYMLVASYLQPVASNVVVGDEKALINTLLNQRIMAIKGEDYTDRRVVVKGCGEVEISAAAFALITIKLRPFAKSIMFGEPCSTVPIFKKK